LRDGHGIIRKVWGGYSPKIYDGSLLELNREWFEENLANAGVIADQHFEWGKKDLKSVNFYTSIKHPSQGKRKRGDRIPKLTKKEQRYNNAVHKAGARMEDFFGRIKTMFTSLREPWGERDE
jgi:hypothetical protein